MQKPAVSLENELEIIELDESQLQDIQGGNLIATLLKALPGGIKAAAKLGTWLGTSKFGNQYFFPKGLKIGNYTLVVPAVVTL